MRDGWSKSTVGQLCRLVKGKSRITATAAGQFPLVTTGEKRKTSATYQLDEPAVCVPMISSTGHGHASLKRVHYQEGKFALSNLLTALLIRDQATLDPRYLCLYLDTFKDSLLVPLMTGAANMTITIDRLAGVRVAYPTLAEQQRIVAILDAVDELRRLRAEADRRTAALVPAIFYEMFGELAPDAADWPLLSIGEIADVQGGLQLSPVRDTYRLRRPYLRVANVHRGRLALGEIKEIGLTADELRRVQLQRGDLLVIEGNGNPLEVGRTAIWDGSIGGCVHQNHLIRIRCNEGALVPDYLSAFINGPAGRRYFSASGNTTSGLVTISTRIVKHCRIPVPPIPLQSEFRDRVAEVRALEEQQAASRARLEALFQALLARAFSGEL